MEMVNPWKMVMVNPEFEAILHTLLGGENGIVGLKVIQRGGILRNREGEEYFLSRRIVDPVLDQLDPEDRSTVDLKFDVDIPEEEFFV